jgi:thiamine biosynthesis protein ThiS
VEGLGPSDSGAVKTILLNGNEHRTEAGSVAELVTELGLSRGSVLVEHGGTALRPEEWGGTVLGGGDRVEILRIVAGG